MFVLIVFISKLHYMNRFLFTSVFSLGIYIYLFIRWKFIVIIFGGILQYFTMHINENLHINLKDVI